MLLERPQSAPLPAASDAQASAQTLLRVEGLAKSFTRGWSASRKRVNAVDDVSFEVRSGEVVGLIGGSGCGKSTIARLITGLEKPDAGKIVFSGMDIAGMRGRKRRLLSRRISLILQDPYDSLPGHMRVKRIIAEPLLVHERLEESRRKQLVQTALEEVALSPAETFMTRYPHELSGGQRQRVALARALVTRPDLVIADEPTSMLDVPVRMGIVRLMQRFREQHGISFIFITHDLALARHFCDRIVVLKDGCVVEQGLVEQIIDDPKHPYTGMLVQAASRI